MSWTPTRDEGPRRVSSGACADPRIGDHSTTSRLRRLLLPGRKQLLANSAVPQNLIEAIVAANRTRGYIANRVLSIAGAYEANDDWCESRKRKWWWGIPADHEIPDNFRHSSIKSS